MSENTQRMIEFGQNSRTSSLAVLAAAGLAIGIYNKNIDTAHGSGITPAEHGQLSSEPIQPYSQMISTGDTRLKRIFKMKYHPDGRRTYEVKKQIGLPRGDDFTEQLCEPMSGDLLTYVIPSRSLPFAILKHVDKRHIVCWGGRLRKNESKRIPVYYDEGRANFTY